MNNEGYSLSTTKYVYLSEGESYYISKTMYSGNDYIIIAFSDDSDVKDLDISLYDEYGDLVDSSTSSENVEMLTAHAWGTTNTKIKVKNYDSYSSYSTYKIKVMIFYSRCHFAN